MSITTSEIDYRVISSTEINLTKYTELLNTVFGKGKYSEEYLKWLYIDNPEGLVFGCDAYIENMLIGHYATIPVKYNYGNETITALLSLNTAVHPDFQGKGLFTNLAEITYRKAKESGFGFVIGVANQNSTPGFIRKLGFRLIAPLEVKFGVGKGFFHLEKESKNLFADRSELYLNWRLKNPKKNYFTFKKAIYCPMFGGLISVQLSSGTNISKLILKKGFPSPLKIIIGNGRFDRKAGFFLSLPKIFKPSPLNLIIKPLNMDLAFLQQKEILIEAIDFDAF
jgi:predicted N-acetyltransferase YhbS